MIAANKRTAVNRVNEDARFINKLPSFVDRYPFFFCAAQFIYF